MIKKMTKYTFVLFHSDVEEFLSNLQNLGVVDITRSNRSIDAVSKEKFDEIEKYNSLINKLESTSNAIRNEYKNTTPDTDSLVPEQISINGKTINAKTDDAQLIIEGITEKLAQIVSLKDALKNANNELVGSIPWGEFRVEDIDKLKSLNLDLKFYTVPTKRYNPEWEKDYAIHIINEEFGNRYFVVVGDTKGFPLTSVKFPDLPVSAAKEKITEIRSQIGETEREILFLDNIKDKVNSYTENLFNNLDLYLAEQSSKKEAEESISILEGFAPTEIDNSVTEFLKNSNVYYLSDAAKTDDNPPIQLKNNFFAKLYEPIGNLYMLPTYGENDLTIFFAPFYMLFFGLCLGDMGYGLVLLLAGIAVNFTVPKYKNYGRLIAWLGFGSIIMPALNGTFFGAKLYEIIPVSETFSKYIFDDMKMFWFAIIFGVFQIVFARILNAIFAMRRDGITAGLSNIGWAIDITWVSVWYYFDQTGQTMPAWSNIVAYIGLALIILFSSSSKNIIVRLFKGTFALYDATGVFGDMLSYIRLFGLGTAGGILGFVVNSVALQLQGVPYLGWLLMIIMLLVGHTAVLLLSCLGAFVHPMRLTFVEFYKNAGFEGGGRAYAPLKKTKEN